MSAILRIKDIIRANLNKSINSEEIINQHLRQAIKDLANVRIEVAKAISVERRTKSRVDKLNKEIKKLTEFAKRALKENNREDAEIFIMRRKTLEKELPGLIEVYEANTFNAQQIKEMHSKLITDIQMMENRKEIMQGKLAATKARETVNNINTYPYDNDELSKFEKEINFNLEIATFESELLESQDEVSVLKDKYENPTSIKSELDKLELETNDE